MQHYKSEPSKRAAWGRTRPQQWGKAQALRGRGVTAVAIVDKSSHEICAGSTLTAHESKTQAWTSAMPRGHRSQMELSVQGRWFLPTYILFLPVRSWVMSPQNSHVEDPAPRMWLYLEIGPLKRWLRGRGRGKKWPKHCMQIWIKKFFKISIKKKEVIKLTWSHYSEP
jgi:hypothetical protein